MPMVKYWKTSESVQARLTKGPEGNLIMDMQGEDYPFPSFPRGHLLVGNSEHTNFSRLKHEIKNQVFNESWAKLEANEPHEEIIKHIKDKLFGSIAEVAELSKYDMLPPESMTPSVREIHRAWTRVAPVKTYILRDYLCFILNEDDGYRNRVQWLVNYFNPNAWYMRMFDPIKLFSKALQMVEYAEVVSDMKERIRLLRRILLLALEDPKIKELFLNLIREIDWSKVALTAGDKYHFRGKYYKVDYGIIEY